jgi:adenylate cyclase
VWRRHLAAAYERILLAPPAGLSAATMIVGFADIVGYTRAARHSAIEDLAALLEAFEEDTSGPWSPATGGW